MAKLAASSTPLVRDVPLVWIETKVTGSKPMRSSIFSQNTVALALPRAPANRCSTPRSALTLVSGWRSGLP